MANESDLELENQQPEEEGENKDEQSSIKRPDLGKIKKFYDAAKASRATGHATEGLTSAAGTGAEGAAGAGGAAGASGTAATAGGTAAAGSAGAAAGAGGTAAAGGAAAGAAGAAAGGAGAAAGAGGAAATTAVAASPVGWIIAGIVIVILIIFLLYMFFFKGSSGDSEDEFLQNQSSSSTETPGSPGTAISIPGVTVNLTGPQISENGVDITYEIAVAYDPTIAKIPIENIVLYDIIPIGATFVTTDGVQAPDSTPSVVTWSLKDPTNQKPFHITLRPTANDIYILHTVAARIASGAGGVGSTDPEEFLSLFAGKGRNVNSLGSRSNFIATIIANSSGLSLAGKESYLGQIYDAGVKYNVNPLIVAGIWGTESGFNPDAMYPFGCLNPADAGFTENVTCSAGSLNQLMSSYESKGVTGSLEIPSTIGNTCIYYDPFIYAYEMYAPICHAEDGNWAARGNLMSFYKKFQGI